MNEDDIVNYIYKKLIDSGLNQKLNIQKDGKLKYLLPNGYGMSHKCDILLSRENRNINIEVKFKSAVTDQFKARAFDAMYLKNTLKNNVYNIMVFVKSKNKGIGIENAKNICFIYEKFFGINENDFMNYDFQNILDVINKYFKE
jgi:hypothetical protein